MVLEVGQKVENNGQFSIERFESIMLSTNTTW